MAFYMLMTLYSMSFTGEKQVGWTELCCKKDPDQECDEERLYEGRAMS